MAHVKTFKVKAGQDGPTQVNLVITPFTDGTPWIFNKLKSSGKIGKTDWSGFIIKFLNGATENAIVNIGFNTEVLGTDSGWGFLSTDQIAPIGDGPSRVYQSVDSKTYPNYSGCWTREAFGAGEGGELRLFVPPESTRIVGSEPQIGVAVNDKASYGIFPVVTCAEETLTFTFSPELGDMSFNLNVIAYLQDSNDSSWYGGYASQDPGFTTRCIT